MEEQFAELRYFGDYMVGHGQYVVRAMLILVLGLIAACLLGKVEATTFLNTRLRTFNGKNFWLF
jgi:hypothetical protein